MVIVEAHFPPNIIFLGYFSNFRVSRRPTASPSPNRTSASKSIWLSRSSSSSRSRRQRDLSSSVAPSASEPSFRHCCCLWFFLIGCLVFVLLSLLSLTRILVLAVWETYPENRCEASVLAVSRADRLSLISGCVTPQRTRQESRWCLGTGNSGI